MHGKDKRTAESEPPSISPRGNMGTGLESLPLESEGPRSHVGGLQIHRREEAKCDFGAPSAQVCTRECLCGVRTQENGQIANIYHCRCSIGKTEVKQQPERLLYLAIYTTYYATTFTRKNLGYFKTRMLSRNSD